MTIAQKLQTVLDIKQSIRTALDIDPSIPFNQYPSIIEDAISQEPQPPQIEGNEYIDVINHPDGGVTYIATELAENDKYYELNGKDFFIAGDAGDFSEFRYMLSYFDGIIGDPNYEVEFIDDQEVPRLLSANRMITSRLSSLNSVFYYAEFNQDISSWDTSNVTDMSGLFRESLFNSSISNWDTSSVTNMSRLFEGASVFNQDISGWDVSSVTTMFGIFYGASAFNQDISGWDVSSVTTMFGAFSGANVFNQDISGWDVSSVTNMDECFYDAWAFNQDLSSWCVQNINSEPPDFAGSYEGTMSWVKDKPVWGTCPA